MAVKANFLEVYSICLLVGDMDLFESIRTNRRALTSTGVGIEIVVDFLDIHFAFHAEFDFDFYYSTVMAIVAQL